MRAFFVWIFALALAVGPVRADGLNNPPVTLKPFNYILNGAAQVSQERGATAFNLTSATLFGYLADGISAVIGSASATNADMGQSINVPAGTNIPNSVYINTKVANSSPGSTDQLRFDFPIEGYRAADLGFGTATAKTSTLQFWFYSDAAGQYGGALTNATGDRWYPFSFSVPSASTWQLVSVTIPGDTTGTWNKTNSTGIRVIVSLGAGSNLLAASSAWTATSRIGLTGQNTTFWNSTTNFAIITGVGLYESSQAPVFKVPDFAAESALCQRYFEMSYNYGVAAGTAAQFAISLPVPSNTIVNGQLYPSFKYQVEKRAPPSVVTIYGYNGTVGTISNSSTGVDLAASSGALYSASSTKMFTLINNSGGPVTTINNVILMHYKADSRL